MDGGIIEIIRFSPVEWLTSMIGYYKSLGVFSGILLPYLEAFLPFLPLSAFLVGNAAAFGLGQGFILSYIGCVAGAWSLYWLCRWLGNKSFIKKYTEKAVVKKYMTFLDTNGIFLVTMLCMIPIFPNSIITLVAGVSRMKFKKFALATSMGILGLTSILSFIGDQLIVIVTNPMKLTMLIVIVVMITFVSKRIERAYIFNH